ncbi:DegT/DnrJ/EryC1/StrS family aminotransferase [Saccharopolyspora pogona]|uniref:DegT/DnrJ/EryC1/StrS family aminotransferase n=1 Tax=Saccharopolyspora pogona TaxID=333966 RepID=UPI001689A6C6|nr:DegT/DnrJ/EryC1/StrS family aminotransferase [Saccharopolyspora pogona]
MLDRTYRVDFPTRGSKLGAAEIAALTSLVSSGAPLSSGIHRDRFENGFREHIGSAHAMSVTSGTVALELAIHLLDLRPGDEVIVTPQTYQATIAPLLNLDVEVTFCDVDPDTLNMDPAVLETLISERTAAVLLVHYGGCPAEMDRITAAAHAHGAVVVEDCAHALGASYHGRRPGALADIGCFSFHNSKNLTTLGEGGMITFDRDDWAYRLECLRSNGVDGVTRPVRGTRPPALLPWMKYADEIYSSEYTEVLRAGTNATLSEAAAAVGSVQLGRLPELSARRAEIAHRLDEALAHAGAGARPHHAPPGTEHAHHLYTFFVDSGAPDRERLVRSLDRHGIEVQLRYFPLHLTPEWRARGYRAGACPVAENSWFDRHVNLPCHPGLTDAQVDRLCAVLHEELTSPGRAFHSSQPIS